MTRTPAYCIAFLALCTTLWLAPFFHAGWKKKTWRFLPHALRHQHSAAALFTREVGSWSDRQLEIQRADGSRYSLDERIHFPTGAFGFRSRYDRIMSHVNGKRIAKRVRRQIAAYVLRRERERLGLADEPLHLRLVRGRWRTGDPGLAEPDGAWSVPPSTELEAPHRELVGGYSLTPEGRYRAFWEPGSKRSLARRPESGSKPTVVRARAGKPDRAGEKQADSAPAPEPKTRDLEPPPRNRAVPEEGEEEEVICCGGD